MCSSTAFTRVLGFPKRATGGSMDYARGESAVISKNRRLECAKAVGRDKAFRVRGHCEGDVGLNGEIVKRFE